MGCEESATRLQGRSWLRTHSRRTQKKTRTLANIPTRLPARGVQFDVSDFGFEVQDSSNFKFPGPLRSFGQVAFVCAGQQNKKHRAPGRVVFNPDCASMSFNNGTRNGQT